MNLKFTLVLSAVLCTLVATFCCARMGSPHSLGTQRLLSSETMLRAENRQARSTFQRPNSSFGVEIL